MNIYYNYHKNKYPKLEKQDIIKLIFQASLGPSHFISNKDKVKDYLNKELLEESGLKKLNDPPVKPKARIQL